MERNHILVRICAVGGPSERRLPPRGLQKVSASPFPLSAYNFVVQLTVHSRTTVCNLVERHIIYLQCKLKKKSYPDYSVWKRYSEIEFVI